MEQFLLAKSHLQDWSAAVDECIEQLSPLPQDAGLTFIYVSDAHASHLGNILRSLKDKTGITHWVGTIGMAVCCTRTEYYEQPAMVLLVTDLEEQDFHIIQSAQQLPELPSTEGVRVAVVHGDPRNGQLSNLIQQLPEQIGNGYLVGGLTSSGSYHYQIADELQEGNLSGIIFNETVSIISGLTQGCSPIGKVHTLTECESNIAITIDNRPALDVMKEEMGEVLARDLKRIGGYIFTGFPVTDTDTGDYLVRNLIGIDPEHGAIAIGDYLKADTPIIF